MKKITYFGVLCLGLFASSVFAEEEVKFGWLNTAGGTYTYTDPANWNNGEINGVFGTNLTSKSTRRFWLTMVL